jgi:Uma2 family endonuclease
VKAREYAAVPTIRRYIMVESSGIGVTVFAHADPGQPWSAEALTGGDTVQMPEINLQIPVDEFYAEVDFDSSEGGGSIPP